jgi:predicted acyltransferase
MFGFSLVSAIAGIVLTANGFVFGWPLPFAGHN